MTKTFVKEINPAIQFISSAQEDIELDESTLKAQPLAPRKKKLVERKTKRVQLVLKPSVYAKLKAEADEAGMSINELITELIETDARISLR